MGTTRAKKGMVIALFLIAAFLAFAMFNFLRYLNRTPAPSPAPAPVPVEVRTAVVMSLERTLDLTGDLRPEVEVEVLPKLSGRIIESILVNKGDYVNKGDVIATLEDSTVRAQLAEARASLAAARASREQIEANLDVLARDRLRLANLFKEKAIARQRLDHVEAEYKAAEAGKRLAEAQIKRAMAALRQLNILLSDHTIRAPANGYISARYLDPGAMSNTKQPVVRISSQDGLKIVTSVTERSFPTLAEGMAARVKVDAFPEDTFVGRVAIVNPTIDPETRTGLVEIHLTSHDTRLRPGMFAHVSILLGSQEALVIPVDGLNRLPGTGNYYVYIVENNRAVVKNITTGQRWENLVEVIAGLMAGDQVVVKGQNRVKDGTKVAIVATDKEGGSR
jgi:RND family efflux transporter MFP subunit